MLLRVDSERGPEINKKTNLGHSVAVVFGHKVAERHAGDLSVSVSAWPGCRFRSQATGQESVDDLDTMRRSGPTLANRTTRTIQRHEHPKGIATSLHDPDADKHTHVDTDTDTFMVDHRCWRSF